MDIPFYSKLIMYVDIGLMGILCIILLFWQINVLRGKSIRNADGSVDDWHEQKLYYGLSLSDIIFAIPFSIFGIVLIYTGYKLGYYITGMASFWFVWINTVTTVTSLRFEKPRITISWIIVFPLGALLGLIYLVWSLVYFHEIF
jgi:hypothetical protein